MLNLKETIKNDVFLRGNFGNEIAQSKIWRQSLIYCINFIGNL